MSQTYKNYDSSDVLFDDYRVAFDGLLLVSESFTKKRKKVKVQKELRLTYYVNAKKAVQCKDVYYIISKIKNHLYEDVAILASIKSKLFNDLYCNVKIKSQLNTDLLVKSIKSYLVEDNLDLICRKSILGEATLNLNSQKKLIVSGQYDLKIQTKHLLDIENLVTSKKRINYEEKLLINSKQDNTNILFVMNILK